MSKGPQLRFDYTLGLVECKRCGATAPLPRQAARPGNEPDPWAPAIRKFSDAHRRCTAPRPAR